MIEGQRLSSFLGGLLPLRGKIEGGFLGQVEAERQCVRGHRFKADGARNRALNHGRHIFLREDREVEVDIMVDCVEMCLPIIMMLTCVKVARPDLHVLKDSSRTNLLK